MANDKVTRCFTFGTDHFKPLGAYVRITGVSQEECREEMFRRYGKKWAFEYSEEQIASQSNRFPLYEIGTEKLAEDNNLLLKADNTCTALGPIATRILLRHRDRLTEIHQSAVDQSIVDREARQIKPRNRFFCMHQDGRVVAAGAEREHAVHYMTWETCLVERQSASVLLQGNVERLAVELAGITFGYIGNIERWGDEREWAVFLPHPGRVGTYSDSVRLGDTAHLYSQAQNWEAIEKKVRRAYCDGSVRIGGAR